jgi:UDP-N-acetylmuramate dehydrogenase
MASAVMTEPSRDLAVQEMVPIGPLTTYRVGGSARVAITARRVQDLVAAGRYAAAHGLPVLVVGRGSNLLVADDPAPGVAGFDGLAVILDATDETDGGLGAIAIDAGEDDAGEDDAGEDDAGEDGAGEDGAGEDDAAEGGAGERVVEVTAGAMVSLPVLARRTVAAGLAGFEWAVGVPGSVGGGVRMNAGGHGSDVAAALQSVLLVDLTTGDAGERPAASLGLRFRGSALTDTDAVARATFRLVRGDRAAGEEELAGIVRWRREHQPGGQNAGSVFVNPRPDSAGRLIDSLGRPDAQAPQAEVSPKHANFIVADPRGRAGDVVALMREVRRRVQAATGVLLRSEIRLAGAHHLVTDEPPFDIGVGYVTDEAEARSRAEHEEHP